MRYLSILPTNHAIDFMVGFIGPFVCGACVVHLRTLRPEFVRDAFVRYRITYMSLVPMVLKNLERGLKAKFEALSRPSASCWTASIAVNKFFTGWRPDVRLSRVLLDRCTKLLADNCAPCSPAAPSWSRRPCSSSTTSAFQSPTAMA